MLLIIMLENIKFKKILKYIIIVENFLIVFLLIFLVSKNFNNYKEKFFSYFSKIDIFVLDNLNYFLFSLISLALVISISIIIWRIIFKTFNYKKSLSEIFHLYLKIFFKRLFSPLGPISPLINIEEDIKKSTLIYSSYIFFITLGSILFFSVIFILSWPILMLVIPFFIYLIYNSFKKLNLKISKKDFFLLLFFSYLNEFFSYACFFYSTKIFDLNMNLIDSVYIYLVWVITSSLFPFLYGSGASEIVSIILANSFGYDGALFTLSIIYYRFIITYLSLILFIFNIKNIFKFRKIKTF